MRRTLIALTTAAGAALMGAVVTAEPAAASLRDTRVAVSVRAATGPVRTAWLTCDPAGGTHRRAAKACAALAAANGDPAAIPPADAMCTMEHAPVTANAAGRWRKQPLRYRKTFGNPCLMRIATGPLFHL